MCHDLPCRLMKLAIKMWSGVNSRVLNPVVACIFASDHGTRLKNTGQYLKLLNFGSHVPRGRYVIGRRGCASGGNFWCLSQWWRLFSDQTKLNPRKKLLKFWNVPLEITAPGCFGAAKNHAALCSERRWVDCRCLFSDRTMQLGRKTVGLTKSGSPCTVLAVCQANVK